jgi:hypothetical protein
VAEAAAVRDGLELARQLGMAKIILECDNPVLVCLKSAGQGKVDCCRSLL